MDSLILGIVAAIKEGGLVTVGVIIMIGLYRQWWVPGWLFKREQADKEEWKTIALRSAGIAEEIVRERAT